MKKLILKFGITALAAFTLVACSSGGGNDGDPVPQANNNAVQTQTPSNQNQTGQDNTNQPSTTAAVAYTTSGNRQAVRGLKVLWLMDKLYVWFIRTFMPVPGKT